MGIALRTGSFADRNATEQRHIAAGRLQRVHGRHGRGALVGVPGDPAIGSSGDGIQIDHERWYAGGPRAGQHAAGDKATQQQDGIDAFRQEEMVCIAFGAHPTLYECS